MAFHSFVFLALLVPFTFAVSVQHPTRTQPHDHRALEKRLPNTWYHRENHPAHALFRRNQTTDGTDYAPVGSATWSAPYPSWSPDPNNLPQPWVDALNAAIAAGKIPGYAPATMSSDGNPVYPSGLDPTGSTVCSGTYKCRIPGDIWDAPDGVFGAGFDDGPLDPSPRLYQFMKSQGVHATHFMIGVNIIGNPDAFLEAFETNEDDIAVHTWTHPYMTTLTNQEVLGELGYTMQLIHNSTGGRLPKYWRPPYGDSDTRVGAIAKEVFGLTTIFWNHDTEDWSIGESGGTTSAKVNASLTKWITGPKSPGLIILEHELSNMTVSAFIDAFPLIGENNWNIISAARLADNQSWWNVESDGSVDSAEILAYGDYPGSETVSSATPSVSASSPASSPSGASNPGGASGKSGSSSSGGPPSSGSDSFASTSGAAAMRAGISWWSTSAIALLSLAAALSS